MDDEVKGQGNAVNYKYRMHDPRIGRFFAVDPLAPKYPQWGPYNFSGNQVVHTFELEGLEPDDDLLLDAVYVEHSKWKKFIQKTQNFIHKTGTFFSNARKAITNEPIILKESDFKWTDVSDKLGDANKTTQLISGVTLSASQLHEGSPIFAREIHIVNDEGKAISKFKYKAPRKGLFGPKKGSVTIMDNSGNVKSKFKVTSAKGLNLYRIGKVAGAVGTVLTIASVYSDIKAYQNDEIDGVQLGIRTTGNAASFATTLFVTGAIGAELGAWGGPIGIPAGFVVGMGFATIEYAYEEWINVTYPRIKLEFNGLGGSDFGESLDNALSRGATGYNIY